MTDNDLKKSSIKSSIKDRY